MKLIIEKNRIKRYLRKKIFQSSNCIYCIYLINKIIHRFFWKYLIARRNIHNSVSELVILIKQDLSPDIRDILLLLAATAFYTKNDCINGKKKSDNLNAVKKCQINNLHFVISAPEYDIASISFLPLLFEKRVNIQISFDKSILYHNKLPNLELGNKEFYEYVIFLFKNYCGGDNNIEIPLSYQVWAHTFQKMKHPGSFYISLNIPDFLREQGDCYFNELKKMFQYFLINYSNVHFILISPINEISSELELHCPNVTITKIQGFSLIHELALVVASDCYIGNFSEYALVFLGKDKPFFIGYYNEKNSTIIPTIIQISRVHRSRYQTWRDDEWKITEIITYIENILYKNPEKQLCKMSQKKYS